MRLERFVAARLGAVDAERVRRGLRREEEEGRNLGRRVEDLGDWDTWFSSSLTRPDGSRLPGAESFEPEHYDLTLTVEPDLEEVRVRVGIPAPLKLPKAKGSHRPERLHYRDILGAEEGGKVGEMFKREAELFHYVF